MKRLTMILEGWWLFITSDKRTEALAKMRKATCDTCPQKTRINTCALCGCYLPAKRRVPEAECPAGNWIE